MEIVQFILRTITFVILELIKVFELYCLVVCAKKFSETILHYNVVNYWLF